MGRSFVTTAGRMAQRYYYCSVRLVTVNLRLVVRGSPSIISEIQKNEFLVFFTLSYISKHIIS